MKNDEILRINKKHIFHSRSRYALEIKEKWLLKIEIPHLKKKGFITQEKHLYILLIKSNKNYLCKYQIK